jgi:hypothetical protein
LKVPNQSFGTAILKPYKTVNCHSKLSINTAFLAIFQRHRHHNKVPVPAQDLHWPKRTSQYRPKKGHDEKRSKKGIESLGFDQCWSCAGTGTLSLVPVPLIDRKKRCSSF